MSAQFNLVLSDDLNRQIDEFADDLQSKSSVMRKALVMYLAAARAQREEGLHVGLFDPKSREIKTEIVGL